MSFVLILAILGISEITAISYLHDLIGLKYSIILYLSGNIIGGSILWFTKDMAIKNFHAFKNIDKKWKKRLKGEPKNFSQNDAKNIRITYEAILYVFACVLVAIPGLVTDIVGIFLAIPSIRGFIIELQINAAIKKSRA